MTESDVEGAAPDSHPIALLLVDVVNPCEFNEADEFLPHAMEAAKRIAELKKRALAESIPVIYANDNFGRWRSDLGAVVDRCLAQDCRGRELCEILKPEPEDYFVLKPRHSAFYCTSLDVLLQALQTRTLVICGFATNICVLFTANDAYIREFKVVVPEDCVAANSTGESRAAVEQMKKVLKARIDPSSRIDFGTIADEAQR